MAAAKRGRVALGPGRSPSARVGDMREKSDPLVTLLCKLFTQRACIPDPHSKRQIKRGAPRTFPLPQKEADAGHFEQPRRRATGGGGQWVHAVEIASPRGGPDHVLSRSATAGHGAVSHHPPARGGSSQRMQLVAARPWFTSGSNNQSSTPAAKVLAMARKAPPALVAPRQRRCDRALPWAAMRFLGAVFGSCRHASAFEVRKDRPIANPLSMMC